VFPDVPRQGRVIDLAWPRRHGTADVGAERIGLEQPFRNAYAGKHGAQVRLGGEVTGVDDWWLRRVGSGKTDVTPTVRFEEQDSDAQPVGRWGCQALAQERYRKPNEFKIGGGQSWVAADEGDGLVDAGREHPATGEQEPGQLGRGLGRDQRDWLWAVNGDGAGQVVLQVGTDAYQIMARLDARGAQLVGIADA
jgi:hypothetical protein